MAYQIFKEPFLTSHSMIQETCLTPSHRMTKMNPLVLLLPHTQAQPQKRNTLSPSKTTNTKFCFTYLAD